MQKTNEQSLRYFMMDTQDGQGRLLRTRQVILGSKNRKNDEISKKRLRANQYTTKRRTRMITKDSVDVNQGSKIIP